MLADELLDAVGVLRRRLKRLAGRPWQSTLTGSQVELLRLVRRRPSVSVADAADELGVAANTVSTLVGQLTALDLLHRAADGSDRRVARLTLTAPARRRAESWRDRRSALVGEAIERLDADDVHAIAASLPALRRLADQLRAGEGEVTRRG